MTHAVKTVWERTVSYFYCGGEKMKSNIRPLRIGKIQSPMMPSPQEQVSAGSGPRMMPHKPFALGKHVTIECYDCDIRTLNDAVFLEQICLETVRQSGATVMSSHFHNYAPQGVSGVIIISESHFTAHTWPEYKYAACDFFSCSESIQVQKAVDSLKRYLATDQVFVSADMARGIIGEEGIERHTSVIQESERTYSYSWKKKFNQSKAWGILTSIDVADCDPKRIRDDSFITAYVHKICRRIGMKRFGDTMIVNFGKNKRIAGFSMTQLIESSLISGHFANSSNRAYIDIFSCEFYEPRDAAEFTLQEFCGSHYRMQVALRL
jgi:S-adenosylmethionine decarboxylase